MRADLAVKVPKRFNNESRMHLETKAEILEGGGRLAKADNSNFVPVCIGPVVMTVGCSDHDFTSTSRFSPP
jgi:hypothetical protein